MPQFNRTASIKIGPQGQEGLEITRLRIKFQIKKTLAETTANSCTVSIFNLAQTTRESINKDDYLILSAGYSDGAGEKFIFIGAIKRVTHIPMQPDIETKIECYHGERALNASRVNLSYGAESLAMDILNDVADAMGMSLGDMPAVNDSPYTNGFSFIGPAKDALGSIADRLGLEWSIQDDEIQLLEEGKTNNRGAIVLKPSTGLKGSPQRLQDESGIENINNVENPSGWKIEALLQPEIIPGNTVTVKSKEVDGNFRVESIEHLADTHGTDWQSTIEIRDIE